MAAIPFLGTIESDDEIEGLNQDIDSEEEDDKPTKQKRTKTKKKKNTEFEDDFQFTAGEDFNEDWNLDAVIKVAKQKQATAFKSISLQDKITSKREENKKKSKKKSVEHDDNDQKQEEQEDTTVDQLLTANSDITAEGHADGSDDCEVSSDDGAEDITKEKKKFFEEPPPQVMHETFTTMNLSRPLLRATNELGFSHPTPIQASTIPVALMGKDICACAATGTGKTAAYMLPILERLIYRPQKSPVTRVLVLVPTRELAIQVHSVTRNLAKHTNIQVCLATGGLDVKGQEASLRKGPDVVIATPGRLVDFLHNAPSFDILSIEILVLDEADRMLDEHFKDQMDEIIRLSPRGRQTMLFSATMTDEVEELASLSLNHPIRLFVDNNTDVAANLRQEFIRIRPNREDDRFAIVTALCCRTFTDHCLLFLQTKRLAHRLRIVLGLMGLKVGELHGNLSQIQRLESLQKFKEGEVDILVATDLASRGLDIMGVKTVINFSLPSSHKQYIHRVGRTARAGKRGRSVSLAGEKERKVLKEVVKSARLPVKSRIVPQEVIEKFNNKIANLEQDVKDILKQEDAEKELRLSEMEMNKARNMIEHEQEIYSRPARVWFQSKADLKRKPDSEAGASSSKKSRKDSKSSKTKVHGKENGEDRQEQKEMEFVKREAKRSRKQKKHYVYPPDKPTDSKAPAKKVKNKGVKAFDKELTDTSKKTLREFRQSAKVEKAKKPAAKKPGVFKSKKRYKRR